MVKSLDVLNIWKFDLPAYAYLGRVLQPPQAMRQEQLGAIMQTGQWQAGIRICFDHFIRSGDIRISDLKLLIVTPFRGKPKPGPMGQDSLLYFTISRKSTSDVNKKFN